MAMTARHPKQSNWKVLGGVIVAAFVVLAAAGYWLDWFGTGATDLAAPGVEQAAPATE